MFKPKNRRWVIGSFFALLSLPLSAPALAQTKSGGGDIGYQTALEGQFRSLGAPTSGSVSLSKIGKNYTLTIRGLKT